jgi:hypothetical protein
VATKRNVVDARGGATDPQLQVTRISPTHFRVRVLHSPPDFILQFLENFDPGWQAESDSARLGSHFLLSGYANGWVVEDASMGSVIDVTYAPQVWVYWSRLFSLAALGLMGLVPLSVFVAMKLRRTVRRGGPA